MELPLNSLLKCDATGVALSAIQHRSVPINLTSYIPDIYCPHMNTKIIFNTDKELKSAAQKKARAQGLTLSAMLNLATRAFVDDDIKIDVVGHDIARAREEIRRGKFYTHEVAMKRLGLKI